MIVNANTIVAVIPKVINTIWGTSFPSSIGRVWWQPRPGLVLDAETSRPNTNGSLMLARGGVTPRTSELSKVLCPAFTCVMMCDASRGAN